MANQLLADSAILEVIRDFKTRGVPLRGVAIRHELKQRFSARAGTDRVYRLVRRVRDEREADPTREQLQQELAGAKAQAEEAQRRAELAEHRERSHFDKWAGEIHELRRKLAALEDPGPSRAEMEKERLRLLKELTWANATVRELTELLTAHGIAIPTHQETDA